MSAARGLYRCLSNVAAPANFKDRFFARSWFFPPERSRNGLKNAIALPADVIVLDLGQVPAAKEKSEVRDAFVSSLDEGLFSAKRVFVRVTDIDVLENVKQDLAMFTRPEVKGFLLPKLKHPDQVLEIDKMLSTIERDKNMHSNLVKLVPILELPEAYFYFDKIASCSKRNIGLMVGGGEFTGAAACEVHSATYDTFFGRALMAAKAAGIEAICGIHDRIDDHAGMEKFCIKMKKSGYIGVVALTPNQVHIINNAFSKTKRELIWTDQVLDGEEERTRLIQSSAQESRQHIGPSHCKKAMFMRDQNEAHVKEFAPKTNDALGPAIRGVRIKKGLSKDIKLGEMIQTPLQVTVSDSWTALWESAFLNTKGYFNRMPQSSSLGLDRQPLPFGLVATTAIAFSVFNMSCYARVHLSFRNMFQHRPVLSGDTVRAMFVINQVNEKNGGDGNQYYITDTTHWMVNQKDEVVFQVDKLTMYSPSDCIIDTSVNLDSVSRLDPQQSQLRRLLLEKPEETFFPHFSGTPLVPGQLIIHDFVKIMGDSEVRMLCTLLNFIHPHHFNQLRYQATEILVPGPFVMSAALSGSAIDIGEVIYEEIPYCINPNKVNFGDQIGTVTYVESSRKLPGNPSLEEVTLRHLTLKNTDMEILSEMDIPDKFFLSKPMKPSEYEAICSTEFPTLLHKIVCVIERRVVRVCPGFTKPRTFPPELLK